MALLARQPGGMQAFADSIPDWEGHFLEFCRRRFPRPASEVLVFPDCGDTGQAPAVMTVDLLPRFIANYDLSGMDLLGAGGDVLFAFDTGDLILVDHDERVWLSGTTIAS